MSRLRLNVNNIEFNLECTGDRQLPTLLLLHGFSGSLRTWDELVGGVCDVARVVALDLIGHGESEAPDDPARYSLDWAVRDFEALLDALGLQRVDLLGYSMGGRLALYFAVHAPHRIRRLVLESATPGLGSAEERASRRASDAALADRIEHEGIEAFVADWETLPLLQLSETISQATRAKVHAERLKNRPRGLANSLRGMGTGQQPSLWSDLARLALPVSLVVGERDQRYSEIGRRMHRVLPDSILTVVPGAGHTVHLDRPCAVRDVLRQARC